MLYIRLLSIYMFVLQCVVAVCCCSVLYDVAIYPYVCVFGCAYAFVCACAYIHTYIILILMCVSLMCVSVGVCDIDVCVIDVRVCGCVWHWCACHWCAFLWVCVTLMCVSLMCVSMGVCDIDVCVIDVRVCGCAWHWCAVHWCACLRVCVTLMCVSAGVQGLNFATLCRLGGCDKWGCQSSYDVANAALAECQVSLVTSHIKQRHTYECIMPYTYVWVMAHIWMSHGTHIDELWHTYQWVMAHIWMSHGTLINESNATLAEC